MDEDDCSLGRMKVGVRALLRSIDSEGGDRLARRLRFAPVFAAEMKQLQRGIERIEQFVNAGFAGARDSESGLARRLRRGLANRMDRQRPQSCQLLAAIADRI